MFTNITSLNKYNRLRWAGHIAYARNISNPYTILVGKLKGRNHDADGKMLLILKQRSVRSIYLDSSQIEYLGKIRNKKIWCKFIQ